MDQNLAWWSHELLAGWRDRPGPLYQGLSTAILDGIEDGRISAGARLPAERLLADALGVSRGTVVAAFEQLLTAGVVRRRQGAGTFVMGRPGWLRARADNPAAALLLQRLAARETLDLSLSVPPDTGHLPAIDWSVSPSAGVSHGLDARGSEALREAVAGYLTEHQQLPTSPDQLVITAGAQQALAILVAMAGPRRTSVVTGCPTYPGMRSALGTRSARVVTVAGDGPAGVDPAQLGRALRRTEHAIAYLMPTGSNPTGAVMPAARREGVLEAARSAGALVVEDLTLADLYYGERPPPPLSRLDDAVVAVGSLGKVFWAGLRIGWIRASEPILSAAVQIKAAQDLGCSVPSQQLATRLLQAADEGWLDGLRQSLAERRDRLVSRLGERLPSWEAPVPAAGLSAWVRLPVRETESYCGQASRHGVIVAPGALVCACGAHGSYVRISFAQPMDEIDLAVDRLSWAWAAHSQDLAATPTAPVA